MPPSNKPERALTAASRVAASAANATAAALLDQIADELGLERPLPVRRIAAYRQAAASLRETPLRLDDLWHQGRDRAITEIPHVTSAIAKMIGDLIATRAILLSPPSHQVLPSR